MMGESHDYLYYKGVNTNSVRAKNNFGTCILTDAYLLLQLVHSPGDVFIVVLFILLDHRLPQVLLQLLVQLFTQRNMH